MNENEARGLFGSLFDFSFQSFVTPKIIKFLYALGLILGALGVLSFIVTSFMAHWGAGLAALVFSPLIYLLVVLYVRILMELLIVIFHIQENTAKIAARS